MKRPLTVVVPLRRNCDPAEVADTAVFLASNLGRGVTATSFTWTRDSR